MSDICLIYCICLVVIVDYVSCVFCRFADRSNERLTTPFTKQYFGVNYATKRKCGF